LTEDLITLVYDALKVLNRGEPLPLDLVFALLEWGVDVNAIETAYNL